MHGISQKNLDQAFWKVYIQKLLNLDFKVLKYPIKKGKTSSYYGDKPLRKYFGADFVCYDSIIIELKAAKFFINADHRQTINNVKATKFKLAILINFGTPSLTYKRIVN